MSTGIIEQEPPLRPIHIWTNSAGEKWACVCHDHGPFCRLCQRRDDVLDILLEHVREGNMTARAKPDGEFEFKMTAKGTAAAENLIHGDPEMALMWAQIQSKLGEAPE